MNETSQLFFDLLVWLMLALLWLRQVITEKRLSRRIDDLSNKRMTPESRTRESEVA